jgi:hypothetical protein
MGIRFALWMALSVRAARPLTYRMAASLLPTSSTGWRRPWNTDARSGASGGGSRACGPPAACSMPALCSGWR